MGGRPAQRGVHNQLRASGAATTAEYERMPGHSGILTRGGDRRQVGKWTLIVNEALTRCRPDEVDACTQQSLPDRMPLLVRRRGIKQHDREVGSQGGD